MKLSLFIILFLSCKLVYGQIRYGTYQQVDTSLDAELKLYPDKKFDFYDTRDESCWVWGHYIGTWDLKKDTITFTWLRTWSEDSDTIISRRIPNSRDIEIEFVYDDGKPIPNVKTSFHCLWDDNTKTYFSDKAGQVRISRKEGESADERMCKSYDRMLWFEVHNNIIKLSSNTSIDYFAKALDNSFKIIIKKKPKNFSKVETNRYLIKGDRLVDIDKKKNPNYSWGTFKFSSTKYGR